MRPIFILSLMLALSLHGKSQSENAAIHATIGRFFDGLSKLSGDSLRATTTADLFLLENGAVDHLDSLIRRLDRFRNRPFERINQFEFLRTEPAGNTAWVAYRNTAQFKVSGEARTVVWMESAALVKEAGRWKIRMLHSTRINQ